MCLIIGLAASSVLVGPAYAGTDIGQLVTVDFWIGLLASIILAIAGWFIKLTIFILSFVILLAGYNGYLDSAAVNVGWVIVRDITNMGFVVILLIIAFGTILGLEQYEWKKLLGKFVFAAIIVNFSRTICGVIIDIAQVIMTTFVNGIAATAGGNLINAFQLNRILELSSGVTPANITVTAQFIAAVGGITFAAMVMGVMFVFLYMLIARMVVLWVLIVLSPLAFVLSILPGTESYAGQWWSKFIANVITGPVLLFFVWLSFVTLGSGNISADIAEHSTSPNKLDSNGADALGSSEQSSGISAVMAWPRMASFAIAIGMLLVGAKAAEELGGEGASAVGSALDFGKKVGSYASGLSAARWAGGHAVEGAASAAKFAAMKVPLVGGDRWINRAKTVGSLVKLRMGKTAEWRNEQAKAMEKWAKDIRGKKGGAAGIGATALALLGRTAIETGGRQAKRAEDWEKAAENQEKIVEESYGTSSSLGGQAKLDTGVRAHQVEALSDQKRKQKYAKKEKELRADHSQKLFHSREQTMFETQAEVENLEKDLHRENELKVAEERDNILRKNNQTPRYKEAALAKHAKEDIELAGSSDYDRTMAKVKYLRDQIRPLQAKGGKLDEKEKAQLKNLVSDMASLQAFNGSRGALFAGPGSDIAAEGLKHDVTADDIQGHQANELAAILQRKVGTSKPEIDAALEDLKGILGKDRFGSFMQNYTAGLSHAADDGAVNKAGLFREQFNAATGETSFKAADSSDADWSKGKRDYAIAQSKAGKIPGFSGSIDSKGGQPAIVSDEAVKRVADMFGNITKNVVSSVDKQSIDTFNEAFKNMDMGQIEHLLERMLEKAPDPDGLEALMRRTNLGEKARAANVKVVSQGGKNLTLYS